MVCTRLLTQISLLEVVSQSNVLSFTQSTYFIKWGAKNSSIFETRQSIIFTTLGARREIFGEREPVG